MNMENVQLLLDREYACEKYFTMFGFERTHKFYELQCNTNGIGRIRSGMFWKFEFNFETSRGLRSAAILETNSKVHSWCREHGQLVEFGFIHKNRRHGETISINEGVYITKSIFINDTESSFAHEDPECQLALKLKYPELKFFNLSLEEILRYATPIVDV